MGEVHQGHADFQPMPVSGMPAHVDPSHPPLPADVTPLTSEQEAAATAKLKESSEALQTAPATISGTAKPGLPSTKPGFMSRLSSALSSFFQSISNPKKTEVGGQDARSPTADSSARLDKNRQVGEQARIKVLLRTLHQDPSKLDSGKLPQFLEDHIEARVNKELEGTGKYLRQSKRARSGNLGVLFQIGAIRQYKTELKEGLKEAYRQEICKKLKETASKSPEKGKSDLQHFGELAASFLKDLPGISMTSMQEKAVAENLKDVTNVTDLKTRGKDQRTHALLDFKRTHQNMLEIAKKEIPSPEDSLNFLTKFSKHLKDMPKMHPKDPTRAASFTVEVNTIKGSSEKIALNVLRHTIEDLQSKIKEASTNKSPKSQSDMSSARENLKNNISLVDGLIKEGSISESKGLSEALATAREAFKSKGGVRRT